MATQGYFNTPPANDRDSAIVNGILLRSGITNRDPALGVKMSPSRPANYVFETKGAGIIAGLAVSIIVMIAVTCTRLYLRSFVKGMKRGIDDILIIPGLVHTLRPVERK